MVKKDIRILVLFEDRPTQWGLRGDPCLWEEMKDAIGELPLLESEDQLILLIERTFEELTGVSLSSTDDILVERYSHGGMSSGYVCTEFWRKVAVPLLQGRYSIASKTKTYKLLTAEGTEIEVTTPGTIGGHRQLKIYGRLDCPSALSHISKGNYVKHRVFFADEATAIEAGFRPCAKCLKKKYDEWKTALSIK
jgi:hypothetical protein